MKFKFTHYYVVYSADNIINSHNLILTFPVYTSSDVTKIAMIIRQHLSERGFSHRNIVVINWVQMRKPKILGRPAITQKIKIKPNILNKPLSVLELTTRAKNALLHEEITTVAQLVSYNGKINHFPNIGKKSFAEIKDALLQHGLRLKHE